MDTLRLGAGGDIGAFGRILQLQLGGRDDERKIMRTLT